VYVCYRKVLHTADENISFRRICNIICLFSIVFYLSYHFYWGRYGFKSYREKNDTIHQKTISIANLENEIDSLQNKVKNLQSNNLDEDLLDEVIRKNMGYAKSNELVIYSKNL